MIFNSGATSNTSGSRAFEPQPVTMPSQPAARSRTASWESSVPVSLTDTSKVWSMWAKVSPWKTRWVWDSVGV